MVGREELDFLNLGTEDVFVWPQIDPYLIINQSSFKRAIIQSIKNDEVAFSGTTIQCTT